MRKTGKLFAQCLELKELLLQGKTVGLLGGDTPQRYIDILDSMGVKISAEEKYKEKHDNILRGIQRIVKLIERHVAQH